ncbi:MAG TPA: MMPL family transporter [Acidimicrobiales bacterium]|nr:MMPL family transporter [Acidimicrobiales bacterium]
MTNDSHPGRLARSARWSAAHRRFVVAAWVLLAVGGLVVDRAMEPDFRNDLSVPGADSEEAFDLLHERFPERAGDSMQVVLQAPAGLDDPAVRAAVDASTAAMASLPDVADVRSPYGPGPEAISADGTIGFITVQFDQRANDIPTESVETVQDAAAPIRDAGVQVEFGGAPVETEQGPSGSEVIGLAAAMIVLLLAFGSVVAMAVPLVTAVLALAVGVSIVGLLTNWISIGTSGPVVAAMIGLGVGIDYALLIVTRHRENMARDHDADASIPVALSTAGRSVLVAGGTVIVAILSLYLIGIDFVAAIGLASAVTVATTLAASVTLLPALLGFAGDAIDRWSLPFLHHHGGADHDSWWHRWTGAIQRRPWVAFGSSLLILLALAVPLFSMRLGSADAGANPPETTTRKAYDLIAEGFGPGFNGPLLVAADLPGTPDEDAAALESITTELRSTDDVTAVAPPLVNEAGDAAVISVIPAASPQDERTDALVHTVRDDVLPTATDGTEVTTSVGGPTAVNIDLADKLAARLPVFMAGVIGLSFLLLMIEFRSLFVPFKAALMNLLSIGAAYGAVVAVFQWGWLSGILGTSIGPIESFAPMMLFAVLFGLSMDYEVFLLSRVREEHLRTGDNSASVRDGIASTARVITAAASVMVIVFLSFLLNDQRVVNLFGFGLAFAILVDATIVRLVLVPSTMDLAGRANWWMPRWLDRLLPRLAPEVTDEPGGARTEGTDAERIDSERIGT